MENPFAEAQRNIMQEYARTKEDQELIEKLVNHIEDTLTHMEKLVAFAAEMRDKNNGAYAIHGYASSMFMALQDFHKGL